MRGGEQQRLPPRGHLGHDPPQIVDKAHVEHAIGLVEDQDLHVRQVDEALLHEVQQAAGRGDRARRRRRSRPGPAAILADAAVNHRSPQPGIAAIGLKALADLERPVRAWGPRPSVRIFRRPPLRGTRLRPSRCKVGRAKAAVLPVPVWAQPSTSRPSRIGRNRGGLDLGGGGIAFRATARSNVSARPSSSNFITFPSIVTIRDSPSHRTTILCVQRWGFRVEVRHPMHSCRNLGKLRSLGWISSHPVRWPGRPSRTQAAFRQVL